MKKPSKKKAKTAKKKASPARPKSAPAKKASHGMHDAHHVVKERRYEVRMLATQVTFAAVSLKSEGFGKPGYTFVSQLSGLLIDSSAGGCSLVFMQANPLSANIQKGGSCVLQIGQGEPRLSAIRWVKVLDQRLINAGFQFA